MSCRNCGHQNPEHYAFCGMCGHKLAPPIAADPKSAVEKVAVQGAQAAPEAPRDVAKAADPADTPRQPEQAEPAALVAKPARRSDKWWVDEESSEPTGGRGGMSILGLSSAKSGKGGEYSYLLEEEQPSHKGTWVFLALVLVLAGVLYAKWQPVRDYVLTTALSHSRPQPQPSQDTKNEPPSTSSAPAPAATPAGSDAASQPAVTSESKPEESQAAQPTQQGLPPADQQSSSSGKPDDSPKPAPASASAERAEEPASKPSGAKSRAAKNKRAGRQSAKVTAKPAAAEVGSEPHGNAGAELVSSGEKYLYARGVARNCRQAVTYFNAAAAQQNPQAFSHLGAMYATGQCVPTDRAIAYAWFRRAYAREPGNRYFERNLTMLWREMTPAERQRAAGQAVARNQ